MDERARVEIRWMKKFGWVLLFVFLRGVGRYHGLGAQWLGNKIVETRQASVMWETGCHYDGELYTGLARQTGGVLGLR